MRSARTNTCKHTISGLLTKRADLLNEAERIRHRLAEIRNDIGAIDRTLNVLGYTGDLDAAMPRQKREVLFGKGKLSKTNFVAPDQPPAADTHLHSHPPPHDSAFPQRSGSRDGRIDN